MVNAFYNLAAAICGIILIAMAGLWLPWPDIRDDYQSVRRNVGDTIHTYLYDRGYR